MIRFKCIYCGQRVLAKDDSIGKKGKCPKCRHELVVPESTKGRPAISPIKEPMPEYPKSHIPPWANGSGFSKDQAKEELTELFKESFGFLIPTYDKLSLFLMAVTWISLFIMNNKLNEMIHTFLLSQNWTLIIYILIMPVVFLVTGIYQIFIKREKSEFEKTIMLWFAIATNVLTGIIASVFLIKNTEIYNWQLIFPVWNIVNAVIMYLMLDFELIDENCIVDRQITPAQVIFGLAAAFSIILVCNYVFKLYWAVTFSICIVYTTSFDRALQSVFPRLAYINDSQEE